MSDAAHRIEELRTEIRRYDHHYYILDDPLIDDAGYDERWRELVSLETEHPDLVTLDSPTQRVGARVSDLFSPISGSITEVNQGVVDNPQIVNDGPYSEGWLLKVATADDSEMDSLMSASEYESFLESEGG